MAKLAKTARSRAALKAADENGFTLLEMVFTLTIVAIAFMSLTFVLFASMKAFNASRSRSFFNEQANKEMETIRAVSYDNVGVNTSDVNYTSSYPSDQFEGRDPVIVTTTSTPAPVTTVTVGAPAGIKLPYVIRRWVTWTDVTGNTYAAGSSPHVYKRLTVEMEWKEDSGAARKLRLISVFYPGGLGLRSAGSNNAPLASFTSTPQPATVGLPVAFGGSASADPDGDPLTYFWQYGDGPGVTGTVTMSHTYTAAGAYTAHLTVTDPGGLSSTATQVITVGGCGTSPPTASFSVSPPSRRGTAPFTVNVDGSGSSDPDQSNPSGCEKLTYDWDWGDGTAHGVGISATHVYNVPNSSGYTLVLTVTDVDGQTGTANDVIRIDPLNCAISAGSFKNPSSNILSNDIGVKSNGQAKNSSFTFYATTNEACTSVTGRVFESSNAVFIVTLSISSDDGTTRQWTGTRDSGNDTFPTGLNQTGEIWSPPDGSGQKFSFAYNVHV
jgi:prepilin-type N-terminal cleavage/methylation domain-containing protein